MVRNARRYLGIDLNRRLLMTLGGHYEGKVTAVAEEEHYDNWQGTLEKSVLYFSDGYRKILGRENLYALIDALGEDMDEWVGAGIRLGVGLKGIVKLEVIEHPGKIHVVRGN